MTPLVSPAGRSQTQVVAQPLAERRLVTVLFADLVGFTSLAEGRDAEEVRDLLSQYFELARAVIDRYGGTIEKFIGDAVMAVWGAPVAHEDDPERAVRAALELLDSIGTLGPEVTARAGVLTGEAAVNIGAIGQGMVAGDLVNTASRLQGAAPAGSVLVGEATMRATSSSIVYEPAGDQSLKGKQAPVPAWRVLRVVAELGGRNRQDGLEAPFVGRDAELRLLKELLGATGRERRARLVSVTGQGGIGKSRLAWEFSKWVDGIVEDIWWHSGRSPAYGEGITFWALAEMVRSRCGLSETDDAQVTRTAVAAAVHRWIPDPGDARRVEPALLALLGIEGPTIVREELFAAWRTFFERIALRGTVVLVFEDLQWADPGVLDFIDHLLEWSRGVPILILTLARPELLDRRPDWGAGRRNFVALHLDPLSPEHMRQLLIGLVPGLLEEHVRAIVERAAGVPLYAVEIVRMLVAEGQLVVSEDGYRPSGERIQLSVPQTLQALIGARLDSLEPDARALVQDASVIGQSFSVEALAAVAGLDTVPLETRLRALVRQELLVEDVDPRSPERGQYVFVQALIREVAYGTIAMRERRVRHLAAARYFEALGDDAMAGALAAHYVAAYRSSAEGGERDALAAQARMALRGAAERATRLGSYDHASGFLRQALEVTTDPAERALLLEQAGNAASNAGRHEEAERLLREAVAEQVATGDAAGTIRAQAALARALLSTHRTDEALEVLAPVRDSIDEHAATPEMAEALGQVARALFLGAKSPGTEELTDALATADRATIMAERLGLVAVIADALITKGGALSLLGRLHEGIALVSGGIELAQRHGASRIALRGLINLGNSLTALDPARSFEVSAAGFAEAQRLGIRASAIFLLGNASSSALETGDWDWAVAHLAAALEQELDPPDRANMLSTAIWPALLRGEPVARLRDELDSLLPRLAQSDARTMQLDTQVAEAFAAGDMRAALDLAIRLSDADLYNRGYGLVWAARAAGADGDRAALARVVDGIDALGYRGGWTDLARAQAAAAILALDGQTSEALAAYRATFAGWKDLGARFGQALCGLEMARRLDPRETEVAATADASRAILMDLGARPFLEQLDAALAAAPAPASSVKASRAGQTAAAT